MSDHPLHPGVGYSTDPRHLHLNPAAPVRDANLADEYRPTMPADVLHLWAKNAQEELRRLQGANERLTKHLRSLVLADALLAAASQAMAECCDLIGTPAGNALEAAIAKATGQEGAL